MIWKSRHTSSIQEMLGSQQVWSGRTRAEYDAAKAEISQFMSQNPTAKVWGGRAFSFSEHAQDMTWSDGPRFYFFVPKTTQPCHLNTDKRVSWHDPDLSLSKTDWVQQVKQVQSDIADGTIGKAVLSRRSESTLAGASDYQSILERLYTQYPNCYLFALPLGDAGIFLGASPERLFSIESDQLATEALAGTRPRGESFAEDLSLEKQLRESDKDIGEHDIVVQHVRKQCDALCQSVTQSAPDILKFTNVQHLYVGLEGALKRSVSPLDVLDHFHPTPAVCGAPTQQALELIESIETHDRGWYGGVIGWMSLEASEFAVGIRSGLLTDTSLVTYTGVGVVAQSDPEKEWDELNHKAAVFAPEAGAA